MHFFLSVLTFSFLCAKFLPRLTAVVVVVIIIVVVVASAVVVLLLYFCCCCCYRCCCCCFYLSAFVVLFTASGQVKVPARGGLGKPVWLFVPPRCHSPPPPSLQPHCVPGSGPHGQHNNCNHWESACFTYQHENLSNIKSKNVATLIK